MLSVTIDGNEPALVEEEEVVVAVELEGPFEIREECESETVIDKTAPAQWCNGAGVQVREDDVQVWISTGDPRGAFTMTARRLPDGRIVIYTPHENDTCPHETTRQIAPGALVVTRSETGAA